MNCILKKIEKKKLISVSYKISNKNLKFNFLFFLNKINFKFFKKYSRESGLFF